MWVSSICFFKVNVIVAICEKNNKAQNFSVKLHADFPDDILIKNS